MSQKNISNENTIGPPPVLIIGKGFFSPARLVIEKKKNIVLLYQDARGKSILFSIC